jgi:hypothetical protein
MIDNGQLGAMDNVELIVDNCFIMLRIINYPLSPVNCPLKAF